MRIPFASGGVLVERMARLVEARVAQSGVEITLKRINLLARGGVRRFEFTELSAAPGATQT